MDAISSRWCPFSYVLWTNSRPHNYDFIVNSYPLFGLKLAGDFAQIGELIWINKSRSGKGAPIVVPVPPLIYWGFMYHWLLCLDLRAGMTTCRIISPWRHFLNLNLVSPWLHSEFKMITLCVILIRGVHTISICHNKHASYLSIYFSISRCLFVTNLDPAVYLHDRHMLVLFCRSSTVWSSTLKFCWLNPG
jgi:hypothetical protein